MSHYEILGIGAPALDSILQVSEEYLRSLPGKKYGMEPVNYATFQKIIDDSGNSPILVLGGSACNTLKGLSRLGRKCALIGKVGRDRAGEHVKEKLTHNGLIPLLVESSSVHTAQIVCLVDPEGQRTMRSFLGASIEMRAQDLTPEPFQAVRLVHIEGYSLLNGLLPARAMKYAKEAGAQVSFDLSSFEIAKKYQSMILALLQPYVDILFANEDEVSSLLEKDPKEGCDALRKNVGTAVISMGKKGCWVGNAHELKFCPAYPAKVYDTTGAGDLFASGFLHGHLQKFPIDVCAHFGAIMGAAAVQVSGTDLSIETWDQIRKALIF